MYVCVVIFIRIPQRIRVCRREGDKNDHTHGAVRRWWLSAPARCPWAHTSLTARFSGFCCDCQAIKNHAARGEGADASARVAV